MSNKRRDLAKGSIKNVLSVFGQIYYNKFIENKAKIESKEMKKAVTTGKGSEGHGQNNVCQPIVCKIFKQWNIWTNVITHYVIQNFKKG